MREEKFSSLGTEKHKIACLIVGRNLGDAVIQSKYLGQLIERGYAERYVVWTRHQVGFLFSHLNNCEVITSPFPVGTNKQFDLKGLGQFLKAVYCLRKIKPTVSLDMIGDFRERFFAKLIGFQPHHYIGWEKGHPFARIIRNPFGASKPICIVPISVSNIYAAYQLFIDSVNPVIRFDSNILPSLKRGASSVKRIGLHPFASQECKLWPESNWRELAHWLLDKGIAVTVYGAPSERDALLRIFSELKKQPEYFTKSIPELDLDIKRLDLMIGLDSFSVHMAERNGVRSIMLNACNHPTLWVPPLCQSISKSGGCLMHPCMNIPRCISEERKYVCIRSLDPKVVADETEKVLK